MDDLKWLIESFVTGIKRGLGFESWNRALDRLFGGGLGNHETFSKVGQGLAEGLRFVWETVRVVLTGIGKIVGVDTSDAGAMAKLAAEVLGFICATFSLSYKDYYNATHTHLSLKKDAPVPRCAKRAGNIVCRAILGGLYHQYARI